MSTTVPSSDSDTDTEKYPPPSYFASRADDGDATWVEDAIEAYLGLTVTEPQKAICRSVATNKRTAVSTANGLGKTYIVAAIANIWLNCRYPAIVFGTSGTGKKLYRTLCRPVEKLHDDALGGAGLPGEYKQQPPRIDFPDPEQYFEAASPSDTGELEGAHSAYTLAIIEETDKDDVTAETIDAMRSLLSDDQDRIIAVGNPPEDEANVFNELLDETSSWNNLRYSSFEGHNVQLERGNIDGEKIDGIASISAIRDDWEDYHDEPWPGVDQAEAWTDRDSPEARDDLSERWYRRRGGITPPQNSKTWRPFSLSTVRDAYERPLDQRETRKTPSAVGIDVARSGDKTVMVGVHGSELRVHYAEQGTNHTVQKQALRQLIDGWPQPSIVVDAIGEGSGLADDLDTWFPNVTRFSNGSKALDETTYAMKWAEGLGHLGQFLTDGSYSDTTLREELMGSAGVVTFSERYLASRGADGATVIEATSKDDIKDRLDHSPDYLDAALMAVWGERTEPNTVTQLTW